ncbi:histone deacetylase [Oleidesulfovibrio alaskensis]|jgi:acetoin utilization deacetylase AcuC-like enzyme|uniref:histone deacetylase family protein n=1 Tax=Oleidesulfovibrio alaskensis TaxID=58180 RepID=UPI00041CC83B|nr:histone deacetylase [Oleidesulfovibrio alaskensis]MBL3581282.1 histone deacetylase [Oleidesulfovibrio alaskensis]
MLEAANKLGIIFFPAYDWAISPTHPEREERLLYTQDQLREEGLFDIPGITEYKPLVAGREDVERVHFCIPDIERVCTKSHLVSAGGAIQAARLVMEGKEDKAFALVRPPGHHAMKVVHGNRGFCNVNIEALMIEHIREHFGPLRVAVIDTDCHHGDGTQDIYWNDPDTLFISLHQDGRTIFPGTGFPAELGGVNALGRTLNIPLPPRTSDRGFLHVIDHLVLPVLEHFKPDIVINSAGQDNHFSDPITDMRFSAQGYAALNSRLNPDIAVLEGGYAIQGALPYVNLGIALAMAGLDYSSVREPDFDPAAIEQSPRITEYVERLCEEMLKVYFNPPSQPRQGEKSGEWWVRTKDIFYDTDGINESQVESVRICPDCAGVMKIETWSTANPLSLGVQVPQNACEKCRGIGIRTVEEAHVKGNYRYIQLINRKDKQYVQYGF